VEDLSNANGWNEPRFYGTIRMGDVDGDGKDDLCARAASGMRCWPSQGTAFGAGFDGPTWSDDSGWGELAYWSTIRLADVDGDGRADLCARAAAGFRCHLSTGSGFSDAVSGPEWSDDKGWSRHKYYSTIRLADVDGDGDLDACARAAAGMLCAPWNGAGFDATFAGPTLSDDSGWGAHRFYSTIRTLDVNDDGKSDLCARASAGMKCWLSEGSGFGASIDGPEWSDASGFDQQKYYGTLRAAGPACSGPSCEAPDAGAGQGGSGAGWSNGGTTGGGGKGGSGGSSATSEGEAEGGCACGVPARSSRFPLALLALLALVSFRRATARTNSRSRACVPD
jgi:hypothetical protein